MGDSWEDDWEAEADQMVAGVDLTDVDESKFAGEATAPVEDDWESAVPVSQPKKVVESRYAAKDRAAAAAAAAASQIDPTDSAAAARAQAEGEMRMFAADLADDVGGNELDALKPKTNTEFETYAATLVRLYGTVHKDSKQYKFFVKQVARGLCEALDTDGIKDVETSLAGVRSAKLKAARESAAKEKKGNKRSVRMESNDITAGLDNMRFSGYGDADDDVDFM
eukprot:jgi/Ulvmu1/8170/UM040_0067.1